jgi:uncharacterized protein YoxC
MKQALLFCIIIAILLVLAGEITRIGHRVDRIAETLNDMSIDITNITGGTNTGKIGESVK